MIDRVLNLASTTLNRIQQLDLSRTQWIGVAVVVFLIGMVCMRGFGSRSSY